MIMLLHPQTGMKINIASTICAYDVDGNRVSAMITSGGVFPTTKVIDVYQAGRIAYETDGANTILATFAYAPDGTPTSVTVGSNPSTDTRYYYVYNPHGDVVALVDGGGTTVATYAYDTYGAPTSVWESFTNGWHNPYLYDGLDRVRYDSETSLYWMSVRAYDPTLGRFLSHDPLGRAPLFFDASQPYAYGGNNPLRNTDPSEQFPSGAILDNGTFHLPKSETHMQTVPPSTDPCANPQSDRCRAIKYGDWASDARDARSNVVRGIRQRAGWFLLSADALNAGLGISTLIFRTSVFAIFEGVVSIASALLGALSHVALVKDSDIAPIVPDVLQAFAHQWLATGRASLALAHSLGAIAQMALEAGSLAAKLIAGGHSLFSSNFCTRSLNQSSIIGSRLAPSS